MDSRQNSLSGMEKIAILMNVIGRDKSLELMKEMKDIEVRRLLGVMNSMKRAPMVLINSVLKEYLDKLSEKDEIIFDNNLIEPELITKALGESRAKHIFGSSKSVNLIERKNLTVLDAVDPKTLAEFLVEEHPQTIALVVAHMDYEKQIEMIRNFPDSLRPEIVLRMASLDYVSPEKVEELDEVLKKELLGKGVKGKSQFGGVAGVAELINMLDKKTMNSLMTRLEDKDPILAEEIRQYIFSFSDIVKIDNRGIQLILREVPNEKLLLSLKSAPDELRDKIFAAMSERAAAMLKDDLGAMGAQKISDVEQAQREICTIVQRLEQEGKIVIGIGEDSDMVA
mgnify:CR=1 FL=1